MHVSIAGSGKGYQRKGASKGKSRGRGAQRDYGCPQKQMDIPQKAIGLILGTGGRNIKALQAVPGIRSVWLDAKSGMLIIAGTQDAVDNVASTAEQHINAAEVANALEFSVILVDVGCNATGMVMLRPEKDLELPVELSDAGLGKEYFVFCNGPACSLEEQMAGLSLSGTGRSTVVKEEIGGRGRLVLGVSKEGYSKEFNALFDSLSKQRPGARIRAEARYGIMMFAYPPTGLACGRSLPLTAFANLELHKDLQPRFFGSLKVQPILRIKNFLLDCGFTAVPPEQRKVVHLIDTNTKKRLSITVAELEDGTDARIGDERKSEIDRIAGCRNYFEVLELEHECSDRDVVKAYYRLAKLVHPDKNAHPGADSAMKIVLMCKDALGNSTKRLQYCRDPVAPPPVRRELTSTKLKVVKCHSDQCKHLVLDTLKAADELGVRTWVRSYQDHKYDSDLLRFLDEAWASQSDGMLGVESSQRYRVDTVRNKTRYRFFDGDLKVVIEHIRQKNIGMQTHERWEVEVRSHELKEAMKSVPTLNTDRCGELANLFHDFMSKVNDLGAAMTSNATRMLRDSESVSASVHATVELH